MFAYTYQCDRCNQTESYRSAIGYYRLSDGTDIPRCEQPAWCNDCNALRSAERLPDLQRLTEIVADLETTGLSEHDIENAKLMKQDVSDYLAESLFRSHALMRWRTARQSPPRCLDCESTNLLLLNPHIEQALDSFPHLDCNGTFHLSDTWHGSQASYQVLDAEGRHLHDDSSAEKRFRS
ncbi:hypothetical protein CA13_11860 [Planctomycetes bacterium CA13]|uniref:Uncharacterized protein n=1 Tax=Novipirellula herctigrandis TaxID=2527986 RepID=A0A5C5YXI5_9BACT|nr:hypothetical protein CA13_11860 [Planctomycetes bacterium CA13]